MKSARLAVLLLLGLGCLLLSPKGDAGSGAAAQGDQPAAPLTARTVVINELSPVPADAEHEWVELVNLAAAVQSICP